MFDAVALDYETVTVIVDATAAATPGVHIGTKQYYYFFTYACFLLSWTWIGSIFFVFFFFSHSITNTLHLRYFKNRHLSCRTANVIDMRNIGVATPTLEEW